MRGAVKIVTPPAAPGAWLALGAYVQGVRDAIDGRIRSVLAGDPGAIASALITGKRDAISPAVYDAMFVSGIGHVLSISGYHMAVVAGIVFFVVRAILALIPGLADRAPIKKWAALAALIVTAFYLVLSGAEVATQRSFIMIAIVLIGVMLDRPILTLRTVTIAALLVLLFAPEAIVHPSFQMSFAATLKYTLYQRFNEIFAIQGYIQVTNLRRFPPRSRRKAFALGFQNGWHHLLSIIQSQLFNSRVRFDSGTAERIHPPH